MTREMDSDSRANRSLETPDKSMLYLKHIELILSHFLISLVLVC